MKIGILTVHRASNYGSVLQAFALQKVLMQIGHEVEIIDYRPQSIENPYLLFNRKIYKNLCFKSKIKCFIVRQLSLYSRWRSLMAFQAFRRNRLVISRKIIREGEKMSFAYDVYVLGSDQIWNPGITQGHDPFYFGLFETPPGAVIISYAASTHNTSLTQDDIAILKKTLQKLTYVSVREDNLKHLIATLSSREISVVLDPTLLAGKEVFEQILVRPSIRKKYVLVYQVDYNPETLKVAKAIARQRGAVVVEIMSWIRLFRPSADYAFTAVSPEEFLGWFKYAECIIAVSFHGVAFSIIFEKDFYYLKNYASIRVENILEKLGLIDRMISSSGGIDDTPVIYHEVNQSLSVLREESMRFLNNALDFR